MLLEKICDDVYIKIYQSENCDRKSKICKELKILDFIGFNWKCDEEIMNNYYGDNCFCSKKNIYIEKEGVIIAKMIYSLLKNPKEYFAEYEFQNTGIITSFCVHPKYRKKNYGNLLLSSFINNFQAIKISNETNVILDVDEKILFPDIKFIDFEEYKKFYNLGEITEKEYIDFYNNKLLYNPSYIFVREFYMKHGFIDTGYKRFSSDFESHILLYSI